MSNRRDYGSGSIAYHKDSKLYQGRVYITIGGKRIRKSVYGKTKRDTQHKLNDIIAKVQGGSYIEQSTKSLALWLEEWMGKYKKGKLKQNTMATYTMLIDMMISPRIGSVLLKDITPMKLQEFFNELSEKYAPATLQKVKNLLNPALRVAIENDMLSKNPLAGVELPKQCKPSIHALSADEAKKLLEAARGYRLFYAIMLALETGLRVGELLALTWRDFSASQRTLSINKTLIEVKDRQGKTIRQIQHSTKTDSGRRIVPLSKGAMIILADHMLESGSLAGEDKDKLIFSTQNGTPYDDRNFNRTLGAICKKAGINRISAHSLRHSFATLLNEKGANTKALSEILGHSKTTTTLDMYVHPSSGNKEEVVNLLGIFHRGNDFIVE